MERTIFGSEHEAFRSSVRQFLDKEVVPNLPAWEAAGIADRDLFTKAGAAGFLGMAVPESAVRASPPDLAEVSGTLIRPLGPFV